MVKHLKFVLLALGAISSTDSLSIFSGRQRLVSASKIVALNGLPLSIYGGSGEDLVWQNMRKDALIEASREPLLASFMHATILSHTTLERALAFHIANLLSSPAMISTQIQALFLEVRSYAW
jgi:hypothetical protein